MNPLSQLPGKMDELLDSFMTHPIFGNTTFGFTNYIFWMCVALALLLIVIFVFVREQKKSLVPQGIFVNSVEYLVEFIRDDMVKGLLGDTWKKHFPFLAALFLFILANNIVGIIPGCHPGTGTIGVTAALALCSFVYFIAVGVKRMGPIGYLKSLAPEGVNPAMGAMVWLIELFSTFLLPLQSDCSAICLQVTLLWESLQYLRLSSLPLFCRDSHWPCWARQEHLYFGF